MAGSIIGAVAAPLIGGAVSSIFGGGKSSGGGSQPSAPGAGSTGSAGAERAAALADPFASQRPQYQQQLSDLMSGKTPFQETAGAKALTETGMNAQSAQMAARGLSNSGAEKAELTKYATGIAAQDYNSQLSNLMQMSGAGSGAPGSAGGFVAGQASADQNSMNTFGSTVGNAVVNTPTMQGWLNGGSGGWGGSGGGNDFGVTPGPGATFDINMF